MNLALSQPNTAPRSLSLAYRFACLLSLTLAAWLCTSVLATAQAQNSRPPEYCFGASGQGCGGWTFGQMPRMAFCANVPVVDYSYCYVSGGSMTHDPCCARNPNGKQCGGPGPEINQCRGEWDRAVSRALWGYQWARVIQTSRGNTTGVVERPLYCAQKGAGVHSNDVSHCCNGTSKEPNFFQWLGRPNLRICT